VSDAGITNNQGAAVLSLAGGYDVYTPNPESNNLDGIPLDFEIFEQLYPAPGTTLGDGMYYADTDFDPTDPAFQTSLREFATIIEVEPITLNSNCTVSNFWIDGDCVQDY
jgi:hypothetical protein